MKIICSYALLEEIAETAKKLQKTGRTAGSLQARKVVTSLLGTIKSPEAK